MRVLVTGANGLLGQKLVAVLEQDKTVTCIATGRVKEGHTASNDLISLDITNLHEVDEVITREKPDVIINTAAMTNVDQCEDDHAGCTATNVTAVKYLVDACRLMPTRLIHLSTDFIFDGSDGPLDELATPNPVNYYGESKLKSERLLMNGPVDWCILRTILVYGVTRDMSRSNIVLWTRKSLKEGKAINVVNDQWRTPTLAEDLAMGCYLAAVKRARGVYNIGGKDMLTPYDIAVDTAEIFQLDKSLIHATDSSRFMQRAKRPPKTGLVIEKARKDLGYEPHSFREGLQLMKIQLESLGA